LGHLTWDWRWGDGLAVATVNPRHWTLDTEGTEEGSVKIGKKDWDTDSGNGQ
jgi:hypothetical protein